MTGQLTDYAKKKEIPDVSKFKTEQEIKAMIPDVSGFRTESQIKSMIESTAPKVDLSGYAKKTDIGVKVVTMSQADYDALQKAGNIDENTLYFIMIEMLNETKAKDKTISKVYQGDDMVWEMPEVMFGIPSIGSGQSGIRFNTYPEKVEVELKIFKKGGGIEEETKTSDSYGLIQFKLKSKLAKGDSVYLYFKKKGWEKSMYSKGVY